MIGTLVPISLMVTRVPQILVGSIHIVSMTSTILKMIGA